MKGKKYRAVVVGCGKIGALFEAEPKRTKPASHAGALLAHPKTSLIACADPDARNRAAAQKLFPNARYYASAEECIRAEKPDIVCLATPPSVRLPLIRECVKSGVKMILSEKPLSTTLAEARAIHAVLKNSGVTFVLNYQRRFSPLFSRVRSDIAKGLIGAVQQVSVFYSNGLRNNGGHSIDAMHFLLGEPMRLQSAIINKKNTTHPVGDKNVDAILGTSGGATIALQSFNQASYAIHDISIFGEKGAIMISDFGQRAQWYRVTPSSFTGLHSLSPLPHKEVNVPLSATAGALRELIFAHEKGVSPMSDIESGIDVMRVIDSVFKSAGVTI